MPAKGRNLPGVGALCVLVDAPINDLVSTLEPTSPPVATAALEDDLGRHSMLGIGPQSFLHAFERPGNVHSDGSSTIFERGHIDHLALAAGDAAAFEALRQELVRRGATDGEVSEFGIGRSVYFEDPDGMGCEVVMMDVDLTPDAVEQAVLAQGA